MENTEEEDVSAVKYYSLIRKYLKKQYPNLSERDLRALCRMVIFASPEDEVNFGETEKTISEVRKNLANFVEREASAKNFIPYSLDEQIADLIEQSGEQSSSLTEYYRWVKVVSDIVEHTGDGVVTHDDATERRAFIGMSYNREIELMLCLAMYQGAYSEEYKDKMHLIAFKLARLRELRNIVFNISRIIISQKRGGKDQLRQYYDYCQQLLLQNLRDISKFRLKLKLNKGDNEDDEEYENDINFLEHLRKVVVRMLRRRRMLFLREQQMNARSNEITPAEWVMLSQNRDMNER